jgi:hypothetical protein
MDAQHDVVRLADEVLPISPKEVQSALPADFR